MRMGKGTILAEFREGSFQANPVLVARPSAPKLRGSRIVPPYCRQQPARMSLQSRCVAALLHES